MLPAHVKQEHNNDGGKGFGNESLIWLGKGVKVPSSLGMQVTSPWERFLILFGAAVTIPHAKEVLNPFQGSRSQYPEKVLRNSS